MKSRHSFAVITALLIFVLPAARGSQVVRQRRHELQGQASDGKAPRLPEPLTFESYEIYINQLAEALVKPAQEYRPHYANYENYPVKGLTMNPNLHGVRKIVEDIVDRKISGDVYETGTWRGGTFIFMTAVMRAYERLKGITSDRHFYGFDSFQGFQKTGNATLDEHLDNDVYAAPLNLVTASCNKFGILDERVHLVKGFFEETVPKFSAPRPIAILRLDGDLYSSTKVVLDNFYQLVPTGGWVVIDDYDWRAGSQGTKLCKEATDEYRQAHGINTPMTRDFGPPAWKK